MRVVVVFNELRDELYRRIDKELERCPGALPDRQIFYDNLLAYYDEHGVIPEFTLEENHAG